MKLDLENLNKKIETDKEVLLALPVNTKKNRKIFVEKVIQLKTEYEEIRSEIIHF